MKRVGKVFEIEVFSTKFLIIGAGGDMSRAGGDMGRARAAGALLLASPVASRAVKKENVSTPLFQIIYIFHQIRMKGID